MDTDLTTPQDAVPLSRRQILAAGALAAGAGLVAGATRGGGQPGGSEIRLATVSAAYQEGFNQVARQYERLHPGARVNVQIMPANGYETWLRTQIPGAGAGGPDLFNANYAWGLFERGLLVDLGPFLVQTNPYTGRPWQDTLNAQFLEKAKVGGLVSYIPIDIIEIAFYYNADIFARLGLGPPRTWEHMLEQAARIRDAGLVPFAVPGNADSYWAGTMGWVARFFSDAYTRQYVPMLLSRPGDWDYDARRNAHFRLNLADPYNDAYVIVNTERLLAAVRDRRIRVDDARFHEAYERIKEFTTFFQKGFQGATGQTAYNLWLTRRAAILLETSQMIGQILRDMDDMPASARFRWSIFRVPPMTTSAFHIPPFRGVGGPGTVFAVVKKNPAQTRQVMDFLMYLTSPQCARILVDQALAHRRPLVGPMLIPGVQFPPTLQRYFGAFEGRGFERLSIRGCPGADEQQSTWEWTVWAQRYIEGGITLDQFLHLYQKTIEEGVPRIIESQHLDMDPRTKDTKT